MPEISEVTKEFLKVVDTKPTSTHEVIQILKERFNLSKRDSECLTACGRQRKFDNRVIYVRTMLAREGKIEIDKKRNIWKAK